MTTRTVVITGASDGIGAAAARKLSRQGAQVVIVGRSSEKTQRVAGELGAAYYLADFARLSDVRRLAAELRSDLDRIDVLANNAGGVMGRRQLTEDGNELTTQVNHLAPFLLTNLLMDLLVEFQARVITTSSVANRLAGIIDLDDLNLQHGYGAEAAYYRAKLMNILFTKELDRRYRAAGIAAVAFHPGIVRTGFSAEFGGSWRLVYGSPLRYLLRSPARGAETMVWLATARPGVQWQPGHYYKNKKISTANPQADDANLARELWERSATVTGCC